MALTSANVLVSTPQIAPAHHYGTSIVVDYPTFKKNDGIPQSQSPISYTPTTDLGTFVDGDSIKKNPKSSSTDNALIPAINTRRSNSNDTTSSSGSDSSRKRSLKYSATLALVCTFDQESAPSDILECPVESLPDTGACEPVENSTSSARKTCSIIESNFEIHDDDIVNSGYCLLPNHNVVLSTLKAQTELSDGRSISGNSNDGTVFHKRNVIVTGTILVANLSYEKRIAINYTFDSWGTKHELLATYSKSINPHLDVFAFSIPLPETKNWAKSPISIQLCISATIGNRTYWDNNFVRNYEFTVGKIMWIWKKDAECLRRHLKSNGKDSPTVRVVDLKRQVQDFNKVNSKPIIDNVLPDLPRPSGLRRNRYSADSLDSFNKSSSVSLNNFNISKNMGFNSQFGNRGRIIPSYNNDNRLSYPGGVVSQFAYDDFHHIIGV